ncbi:MULTISPECIES: hypothetical protein [unclassified Ruegeria]|uniref:hypothetical protein n=1 Tax=unclassified Ruegeria TaxID=2625375 RepID=UPI0014884516|nr:MULTISPECIES: hypothetical protein [unclassified Ruegeria]NOD65936.1 hypothetical protein [Ruegeria sp. HKCCD6109]
MRTNVLMVIGAVSISALAACDESGGSVDASAPTVGSSSDLSPFEGARAGQAEMGIQSLGFELIRSEGLTSYWFNKDTGACAQITTSEGRYSDVAMLPSGDC